MGPRMAHFWNFCANALIRARLWSYGFSTSQYGLTLLDLSSNIPCWQDDKWRNSVIHGGLSLTPDPVIEEMVDTLNSKFRTKLTILNSKSKLPNSLKSEIEINQLKSFNKSDENKLRSSTTYYSHNVLGNENI